jgi:hypothetical protein
MNIWKTIVGLIVTSVLSGTVSAQSSTCEEQLNAAAAEFAAGRFYGIPAMLKPCIDKGFTREQRQRAYLLLTQTYLLLEDPIAAEDSYLRVLKANPEFETDPANDPIEVVYLSKKFTAAPIFSIYASGGGNTSVVRVIHDVPSYSGDTPGKTKYSLRPGWQATGGVEWSFSNHVSLCGELTLSQTSYKKNETFVFKWDELELIDKQLWLSVPISIRYSDNAGKIRPYGFLGYSVNLLLQDNGDVLALNNDLNPDGGDVLTKTAQSVNLSFDDQRKQFNFSFFAGGGVKYKWDLQFIFAELRYSFGLRNIVNPETIFDSEAFKRFGLVDDYFRLDNLALSFGYVRPLYKPRKLNKARTKGLLRFIKRTDDEGAD